MKNGSKEDYLLLDKYEQEYINGTAIRILNFMSGLNTTLEGYKITRSRTFSSNSYKSF